MAVSKDPVYKKARALGISPAYLGYTGESKRALQIEEANFPNTECNKEKSKSQIHLRSK